MRACACMYVYTHISHLYLCICVYVIYIVCDMKVEGHYSITVGSQVSLFLSLHFSGFLDLLLHECITIILRHYKNLFQKQYVHGNFLQGSGSNIAERKLREILWSCRCWRNQAWTLVRPI